MLSLRLPRFETRASLSFRQVDLRSVAHRKTKFQNSSAPTPPKKPERIGIRLRKPESKDLGNSVCFRATSQGANHLFGFLTLEPRCLRQRRESMRRSERTPGTAARGPTTSVQVSKPKPRRESLGCGVQAFDLPLCSLHSHVLSHRGAIRGPDCLPPSWCSFHVGQPHKRPQGQLLLTLSCR